MPSFQIAVAPHRRAAARWVDSVRHELKNALLSEKAAGRCNQSKIATVLGVHRSVISRELNGRTDLSLERVAEVADILGYRISFSMDKPEPVSGSNGSAVRDLAPERMKVVNASGSGSSLKAETDKWKQFEATV